MMSTIDNDRSRATSAKFFIAMARILFSHLLVLHALNVRVIGSSSPLIKVSASSSLVSALTSKKKEETKFLRRLFVPKQEQENFRFRLPDGTIDFTADDLKNDQQPVPNRYLYSEDESMEEKAETNNKYSKSEDNILMKQDKQDTLDIKKSNNNSNEYSEIAMEEEDGGTKEEQSTPIHEKDISVNEAKEFGNVEKGNDDDTTELSETKEQAKEAVKEGSEDEKDHQNGGKDENENENVKQSASSANNGIETENEEINENELYDEENNESNSVDGFITTDNPTKSPVELTIEEPTEKPYVREENEDVDEKEIYDEENNETSSVDEEITTGNPTKSPAESPTEKITEKPYVSTDDDPIKQEDEIHAEEEEVQELEIELKQEEKVARQAGGLGIFLGIVAMIFTAHQMSENPDGIYASVCRLAITISSVVVKIVCMPCRKLVGANGNSHHHGHMPISTNDYSYRNDPYRSNANAGFEMS